jgi:hypothetical protein
MVQRCRRPNDAGSRCLREVAFLGTSLLRGGSRTSEAAADLRTAADVALARGNGGVAFELLMAGPGTAAARLAAAAPAGAENYWAGACLARAAWRLRGDTAQLELAVTGWERIEARFERACTLLLPPDRAAEGQAELRSLGCPPPAG